MQVKSKYAGLVILLAAIAVIAIYYGFPSIWQMPPQGSHLWRQTDCMAMVWNYKLYDLPFFQPATFNLQSTNGNVAGEFPVFYFIAAQTSNPEFYLRLMHSMVLLGGIVSIYFIALYFLKNAFLAVVAALLLFTSPLLVFYGNNFLSDVPAWSFAMMGWAVFVHHKEKTSWLFPAFFFFACAMLLKASHAINFAMAFAFQILDYKSQIINHKSKILNNLFPYSLLLVPCLWYIYAKRYNSVNHDTYYFLSIFPVWKMSLYDIGLTGWRLLVSWSDNYFFRPASVLLLVLFFWMLIKRKIENGVLKKLLVISSVFTAMYMLLFFERLKLHEYYYPVFFIFGTFAVIAIFQSFQHYTKKIPVQLFLFLFLAINIFYCNKTICQKLQSQPYNGILASDSFQNFLIEKGCTKEKIVFNPYDPSVNQSLYWMKRKGYTAYKSDMYKLIVNKETPANIDYLIIPDNRKSKFAKAIPSDSIGSYQGIQLYKIKKKITVPRSR